MFAPRSSILAMSYARVGPSMARSGLIRTMPIARYQSSATEAVVPKSRIGQLIQQSKELLAFYKNGIKTLWENNKTAKALAVKVQEGYQLNRYEYQLVHHTKQDMRKLIPFGVLVVILPESIPFFVVFMPGLIPSTCIKDSQLEKQRIKLDKKRQEMSATIIRSSQVVKGISLDDFTSLPRFKKITQHYGLDFTLDKIDRRHLAGYCRFMGLNGLGTRGMLRSRLDRHFHYLTEDDQLLEAHDIDEMTSTELQQANEERGMRSLEKDDESLRSSLRYWLAVRKLEPNVPSGLLVCSRMFLLNANFK
ncbi:LETM1-like protein [Hesseltinella vesiculosa]|uniref:LETM1-like protein n=1 Tax=Hesseltinella vesiculosa TaxID=101127 RepID=A0A1X2GAR8_9FUNG|nr:LETM1-like protein [Hesseltinella vesiculosa]